MIAGSRNREMAREEGAGGCHPDFRRISDESDQLGSSASLEARKAWGGLGRSCYAMGKIRKDGVSYLTR